MARNGSGQFDLLVNTWNPATNGVLATAGDYQALINDIAAALTQSVSRDGQSPMIGNLPMGNNKVTGVAAGTGTGEALAFQQLFSQGVLADIASAATTDIGLQNTNFLRVTGNTTITSFGTNYRGPRFLVFESALTLTNSSTLVLPGGANIAVNAGDAAIVIPGATLGTADKWIVVAYQSATNPSQVVTLTGTQTLTNKTLTNPVINGFTGSTAAINIGSGQLVKDTSGNLGLGVTPSAWGSGKAIELGQVTGNALWGLGINSLYLTSNARWNGSNYVYTNNGAANLYGAGTGNGTFTWFTAPSGTAGNAISFTQALTLTAAGELGLGSTSPARTFQINASSPGIRIQETASGGDKRLELFVSGADGVIAANQSAQALAFQTTGTERARIDSSGNLLVGKSATNVANAGWELSPNGGAQTVTISGSNQAFVYNNTATSGTATIAFRTANVERGNIAWTNSATSYNTSSDYRLKEAVQPMTGALAKVAALKPCTYKWKVDGSDGEGFIAHELQEVCPDAVTGEKDAVNEDGSIKPQGIDTSFLVATLTAAIQELKAEFDAYKATHP